MHAEKKGWSSESLDEPDGSDIGNRPSQHDKGVGLTDMRMRKVARVFGGLIINVIQDKGGRHEGSILPELVLNLLGGSLFQNATRGWWKARFLPDIGHTLVVAWWLCL